MPRCIDAELMTADIQRYLCANCSIRCTPAKVKNSACEIAECLRMIDNAPTVDAEPVKHGRWIRGENKSAFPAEPPTIWYCSCCGEMIRYNDSMGTYQKKKRKVNEVNPRCRRCGARMDGDSE